MEVLQALSKGCLHAAREDFERRVRLARQASLDLSVCLRATTRAWHRAGDECGFHEDRAEDYRLASRFS